MWDEACVGKPMCAWEDQEAYVYDMHRSSCLMQAWPREHISGFVSSGIRHSRRLSHRLHGSMWQPLTAHAQPRESAGCGSHYMHLPGELAASRQQPEKCLMLMSA